MSTGYQTRNLSKICRQAWDSISHKRSTYHGLNFVIQLTVSKEYQALTLSREIAATRIDSVCLSQWHTCLLQEDQDVEIIYRQGCMCLLCSLCESYIWIILGPTSFVYYKVFWYPWSSIGCCGRSRLRFHKGSTEGSSAIGEIPQLSQT